MGEKRVGGKSMVSYFGREELKRRYMKDEDVATEYAMEHARCGARPLKERSRHFISLRHETRRMGTRTYTRPIRTRAYNASGVLLLLPLCKPPARD